MKTYLILSYEGNVKILDIPNNVPKAKVIEVARRVICETKKPVTQLNNVTALKNYEIFQYVEQQFGGDVPQDLYVTVNYGDYK